MLHLPLKNAIKKTDLHIGSLYICKSGKVELYLGRNSEGRYVFYTVGAIDLFDDYRLGDTYVIFYEDIEFKYLLPKVTELMQKPMQKAILAEMIGIPVLLYEIPFMNEKEVYMLFAKRNLLGLSSVQLSTNQDFDEIDNPQPIKAKNLKIGYAYVGKRNLGNSSEGNPTYIYLGRTEKGLYVYFNISGFSGVSFHRGFEDSISFYSKYQADRIEYLKTPKTLYKPIFYRQFADIDTTPLLKKYHIIK